MELEDQKAKLASPDRWPAFYWIARHVLFVLAKIYFRAEVHGLENLPRRGGIVLASNHASNLDPAILGGLLPRVCHFLAKEELFRVPVFGRVITALNSHPINRSGMDRAALRACVDAVRSGYPLTVFPEGTRTPNGELLPAKPGLALIARQGRAPVVPIYIDGTFRAMPRGVSFPRPAKIRLFIGKAMEVGAGGEADVAAVMDAIRGLREQAIQLHGPKRG